MEQTIGINKPTTIRFFNNYVIILDKNLDNNTRLGK